MSILAVGTRLILINQPYIDNWSWRQSDVAAIARNFYQNGFHFTHPQIDWAGDQPGYVGTEFPILAFLAAISYKVFGVHEWIGRIQAVILFAASLPFFFLLARDLFGVTAAIWALFFYSFAPLNLFASREFMPDVPSLSLALIGLYFFVRHCRAIRDSRIASQHAEESRRDRASGERMLIASAGLTSVALLIKLPTAIIGAPLACLACQRFGVSVYRRIELWIFAAVALLPSVIWYWHAHAIAEQFYPHHFFGAGGIHIMSSGWYWKIAKQMATSSLTPLLVILATCGVFVTGSTKNARLLHWWLAAMILFIVVVGYGNRHQWYQLPLVPIAAALAGAACTFIASKVPDQRAKITLLIFLAASFGFPAFHYAQLFYHSSAAQLRDVGLELKRRTPENSLIVAADNGDPTILYYAERKGWHFLEKGGIYEGNPNDSEQVIVDFEQLRGRGATHLVFTANTIWWLDYYREFGQHLAKSATLMETTSEFRIYKLNPSSE